LTLEDALAQSTQDLMALGAADGLQPGGNGKRRHYTNTEGEGGRRSSQQMYKYAIFLVLSPFLIVHSRDRYRSKQIPYLPPDNIVRHMCEMYFVQINTWVTVLHMDSLYDSLSSPSGKDRVLPVLHAIAATFIQVTDAPGAEKIDEYESCRDSVMLQIMTKITTETLQAATILAFVMFGHGTVSDHWPFVCQLPALAMQLCLHLEQDSLKPTQVGYRRVVKFPKGASDWVESESQRRLLFWNIVLLDRLCAIFSGLPPIIPQTEISRRLPCEGLKFQQNEPTQTRHFIPTDMAVELQVAIDPDLGGFAYAIEATAILGSIATFALAKPQLKTTQEGMQKFVRDFLSLDLILTNWKARLPPRWQRATCDKGGVYGSQYHLVSSDTQHQHHSPLPADCVPESRWTLRACRVALEAASEVRKTSC
jgi:hypothetical protein